MNRLSINKSASFFRSLKKKKQTEYHYIQNFENADEKMCKKYDKNNDNIYERNCALYTKTKRFLEKHNAIFKMDGPPDPPRVPSNYELYIIHKNRNSHTNNKIQTIAILYLLQHEYTLIIDPDVKFLPKVMNKENKLFEPYMAIDIASSLNKDFVKELSKSYKFNGTLIENPELLTFNEKLDHFNKNGVIKYVDISNDSSVVDSSQHNEVYGNNMIVDGGSPVTIAPITHAPINITHSVGLAPVSVAPANIAPASIAPAIMAPASVAPSNTFINNNMAPASVAPSNTFINNNMAPIPSAPELPPSNISLTQAENEGIYPLLNTTQEPPAYTSENLTHKHSVSSFGDEGGINIFINKNK
jgi:hypothetical protein